MSRVFLIALAVQNCCAATAVADEYLLRIDTVGYLNRPAEEKAPQETALRSIEVRVRPESTFHGKVNVGKEIMVVSGKLVPSEEVGFVAYIKYEYSIDSGHTTPTESGGRKPVLETTSTQTCIGIAPGGSVSLGDFDTTLSQQGKPTVKSKSRHILVLSQAEPAEQ
jgi:hypothetical protein